MTRSPMVHIRDINAAPVWESLEIYLSVSFSRVILTKILLTGGNLIPWGSIEVLENDKEIVICEVNPTTNLSFSTYKGSLYPDAVGVTSLHFDIIIQVTFIL